MFRFVRCAAVAAVAVAVVGVAGVPAGHADTGGMLRLVPVTPCRLIDTRTVGVPTVAGTDLLVQASGVCDIPADAVAVVVSAVATRSQAAGWLDVRTAGSAYAGTSLLNFGAGATVSNQSIVELGDGALAVRTSVASDVVVDVTGYMTPADEVTAGRLVPVAPRRLLDTRAAGRVSAGGTVTVPLPEGVPSNASAVAVTITSVHPSAVGFLSAYPAGGSLPTASVGNFAPADAARAGLRFVPCSPDGITIFASAEVDVVVDVVGYFTGESAEASSVGLYRPVSASRVLDSRLPSSVTGGRRVAAGGQVVTAASGSAQVVVANLTVVGGAGVGWALAQNPGSPAGTSSVNFSDGAPVADAVLVPSPDGAVQVSVAVATHVIVDVVGGFTVGDVESYPIPVSTPEPDTPSVRVVDLSTSKCGPLVASVAVEVGQHVVAGPFPRTLTVLIADMPASEPGNFHGYVESTDTVHVWCKPALSLRSARYGVAHEVIGHIDQFAAWELAGRADLAPGLDDGADMTPEWQADMAASLWLARQGWQQPVSFAYGPLHGGLRSVTVALIDATTV